jgi:hypothetical protein
MCHNHSHQLVVDSFVQVWHFAHLLFDTSFHLFPPVSQCICRLQYLASQSVPIFVPLPLHACSMEDNSSCVTLYFGSHATRLSYFGIFIPSLLTKVAGVLIAILHYVPSIIHSSAVAIFWLLSLSRGSGSTVSGSILWKILNASV